MTAYTTDEVRDQFIDQVCAIVRHWERADQDAPARIRGVVFSVLAVLDGASVALPGFQVIPYPHPDDQAYHEANGERYYPPSAESEHDIAGELHDLFAQHLPVD